MCWALPSCTHSGFLTHTPLLMPENQHAKGKLFLLYSTVGVTFIKINKRYKQGKLAVKMQRERGWVGKSPSDRAQYNPQWLLTQSTARKVVSWLGRLVLLPSFWHLQNQNTAQAFSRAALVWSVMPPNSVKNLFMISVTSQLDSPIYILTIHRVLGRTVEEPRVKLTEEVPKLIVIKCKTVAASASLSCLSFSVRGVPEQSWGLK